MGRLPHPVNTGGGLNPTSGASFLGFDKFRTSANDVAAMSRLVRLGIRQRLVAVLMIEVWSDKVLHTVPCSM
jgi:hypothetical protein